MRRHPIARVISLAVLLPLLALAVSGFGYDRFRCAFSGEVSDVSEPGCCPAEDPPAVPIVGAASCCDHESAQVVRPPAEIAGSRVAQVSAPGLPVSCACLPVARPAPVSRLVRIEVNRLPHPPLLLLKQSFLI
jgi:hypothetical protein